MRRVAGQAAPELSQYRRPRGFVSSARTFRPWRAGRVNRGERLVGDDQPYELKPWRWRTCGGGPPSRRLLDRIKVERISEFHSDMLAHFMPSTTNMYAHDRRPASGRGDRRRRWRCDRPGARATSGDFEEEGQPLEGGESDPRAQRRREARRRAGAKTRRPRRRCGDCGSGLFLAFRHQEPAPSPTHHATRRTSKGGSDRQEHPKITRAMGWSTAAAASSPCEQ